MIGAIDFVTKAKLICDSNPQCIDCKFMKYCGDFRNLTGDVVRMIMGFEIKEGNDAESIKED